MKRHPSFVALLAACGLYALATASSFADDTSVKQDVKEGAKETGRAVGTAAREVGHGTRKVTKEVGHAVKDAAKTTGHAFRDGAKEFKKAVKGEGEDAPKKTADKNVSSAGPKK